MAQRQQVSRKLTSRHFASQSASENTFKKGEVKWNETKRKLTGLHLRETSCSRLETRSGVTEGKWSQSSNSRKRQAEVRVVIVNRTFSDFVHDVNTIL